jgi:hypothetical protein
MARDRHRTRAAVQRLYRILAGVYVLISVGVVAWIVSNTLPNFYFLFGVFAGVGIILHFAFQMALWAFGIEAFEEDVFDDPQQEGRHDDGL